MMDLIYDKSDKGREEIATRKFKLAPKVRPLLVLVDGKHSGQSLLKKYAYLGLTEQIIAELMDAGFIHGTAPAVSAAAPAEAAPAGQTEPAQPAAVGDGILEPGETQYQAIYNFYTHTIKSTIGLRGFVLQLKVEKCSGIDDFRALRVPYVEAVFKAQGEEMARSLRLRLDQLLYLGEAAPNTVPLHA